MQDLRVDLAAFQGPLDLLLHLVIQEEVDVQDIPIARIADRFLEICRTQVERLDVDRAGEYLVMATQLLVLKSRALLPRDTPVDLEDIDPRLDLVRQLLEYRRFKGAAAELADRAEVQAQRLQARVPKAAGGPPAEEDLEVDLFVLVEAFQRLLRETGDDEFVAMPKERLPITHFVGHIFDELVRLGGRVRFTELLGSARDRTYVIGAFLALLELIKLRRVRAVQEGLGEIYIELGEAATDLATAEDLEEQAVRALDAPEIHEDEAPGPRIVFMGSPEFAVPTLRSLVAARWSPRLVITPPPRRAGRGRGARQVPLAQAADDLQLPLHRTNDVNGRASLAEVAAARPDVVVTAGFGQKLGADLLALPPRGCLNLHASLLPRYRGASPIAAAIRAGESRTGVTLFRMDEELDHGPVIAAREVPIGPGDTADDLSRRMAEAAAQLLMEALPAYLEGRLEPVPQEHAEATYVGRLCKEDGVIDWRQPAARVHDQIRSVTSWPGAQTAWQPKVRHAALALLVLQSEVAAVVPPGGTTPGVVLEAGPEGIVVACGEGAVRVLQVRPAGGRALAVRDFLNARRVVAGDRFVAPAREA